MPRSTPNLLGVATPGLKIVYPINSGGGMGVPPALSGIVDPNGLGTPYAGLFWRSGFSNVNNNPGFNYLNIGGQQVGAAAWPHNINGSHQFSVIGGIPSVTLIEAQQLIELTDSQANMSHGSNDQWGYFLFPNVHGCHDCNFPTLYPGLNYGQAQSVVVTAAVPGRYVLIVSIATASNNIPGFITTDVKLDGSSIGNIDAFQNAAGIQNIYFTNTFRAYIVNLTAGDHTITLVPSANISIGAIGAHLLFDHSGGASVAYGACNFSFAGTPIRNVANSGPLTQYGLVQYGGFGATAAFDDSIWEQFLTPSGTSGSTQQIEWAINGLNWRGCSPVFGATIGAGLGNAAYIDLVTDVSGHISADGNDRCAAFWLPQPYIPN